jgi:predicted RNA-binding Zn ribbon-like protein
MDFLNTRPTARGAPMELIGDGPSFAAWLEGAGLLDATTTAALRRRVGAAALDAAAAQARELREWTRDWISRWREAPGGNYRAEVRRLNDVLGRAGYSRELIAVKDGFRVAERRRLDSADDVIALVAEQIASLVTTEQPALVKRCTGPGCTLWFVDRTKAHSRLFCSATACGNRAKVAAFRERQRGQVS